METIKHFNSILHSFKINASCVNFNTIDNYLYYDIMLNDKTKVKDIVKYFDELSLALKMPNKPSLKILHNEGLVRLEFFSHRKKALNLFDIFTNNNIPDGEINCLLGKSPDGQNVWMDLSKNPHMLVAGTTGSGKSILLHTIIANLFNYNKVKLNLIDPKRIEFSEYENKIISSNLEVRYTYPDTLDKLDELIDAMEQRYSDIRSGYKISNMPPIVLIIDEFADLILQDQGDLFYRKLCMLAQKCRAAKIYIILGTQRPSVNIVNGTIKANFPARIACKTASYTDSKVILDSSGAEDLLGKGDALLKDNFRTSERFQIAYRNSEEVCKYFAEVQ